MATRSIPFSSSESLCQIFETSKPTISNATVRSLSQLEPGKTITAAFIREALSQNFQLQY